MPDAASVVDALAWQSPKCDYGVRIERAFRGDDDQPVGARQRREGLAAKGMTLQKF